MNCKIYRKIKKLIPLQIKSKMKSWLKGYEEIKQVDKTAIIKAKYILLQLGIDEIILSYSKRKVADYCNQIMQKDDEKISFVKVKSFGSSKKEADKWSTSIFHLCDFCRGILDIEFDELYLLMVKSIARSYKKICIINYGSLAIRFQKDLDTLGIAYDSVEPDNIQINHKTRTIIANNDYDLIWCPIMNWIDYHALTVHGTPVFLMPAVSWYMNHFSRFLGYDYEYDIALNIIPLLKKVNVKTIVLEDISKYKRDNDYDTDPLAYVNATGNEKCYDEFFKTYPLNAIKSSQGGWCIHGNYIGMQDYKDEYRECIAGERITCNTYYNDKPNAYFIGPCTFWGGYVSDEYTIESMIQNQEQISYNCHNMTSDWTWSPLRIRTLPLKAGDVIVLVSFNDDVWKKCGISLLSIKDVFDISDEEYRSYTWDCPYHCNEKLNQRFAKLIGNELIKCSKMSGDNNEDNKQNLNFLYNYKLDISQFVLQNNNALQSWYMKYADEVKEGKNGAIVMNCNPFTYGHQYLIEYAASRVEHLYIFVVEEDKSYYSFKDRYMMVKENCKNFGNVSVMSSGKFMISVSTLAGYFDKDSLQDRNVFDAVNDLELFGSVISKLFHIKYRFVGEEPTDGYTNNYNEQMKTLLPQYGVEVIEVLRLKIEGKTVSGSYCRSLYEQEKWDVLARYIPKETMKVLRGIRSDTD